MSSFFIYLILILIPLNLKADSLSKFSPSPFKQKELHKESKRVKEDLEFYALGDLTFVGVLKQNSKIWGLIKAPNAEIFKVYVGNFIGKNKGVIKNITEQLILIEEGEEKKELKLSYGENYA